MIGVRLEQAQIRRVVVRGVSVDVINDFPGFQVSTKLLLHHKTMFPYVPLIVLVGMIRDFHKNVSSLVNGATSFPEVISLRSGFGRKTGYPKTNHAFPDYFLRHSQFFSDLSAAHPLRGCHIPESVFIQRSGLRGGDPCSVLRSTDHPS